MSNSAIYMNNAAVQTVAANGFLNLGAVQRRFGCALKEGSSGANVSIKKCGYYLVIANVTYTAPAAGNVSIAVQNNGATVPGLVASDTVATATTEINSMVIVGIFRSFNGADTLSIVNTGTATITPSNVSFTVIKL